MERCMKTGIGSYAVQVGDLKIGAVVPEGRTWGRVMRGSGDIPSIYMNLTERTFSAKTVGAGTSLSSYASSHELAYTKANTFAFVCDGAGGVSLYINGIFCRKDTGFTANCTEIGCGDTNGANYYFNELTVESFRVYNSALTAEEIAALA